MQRVPVIDKDGTPLMPTKASRARRMVRDGKAVGKRNKLGIYYIQLVDEPSGRERQSIAAGIDPGKYYSLKQKRLELNTKDGVLVIQQNR